MALGLQQRTVAELSIATLTVWFTKQPYADGDQSEGEMNMSGAVFQLGLEHKQICCALA